MFYLNNSMTPQKNVFLSLNFKMKNLTDPISVDFLSYRSPKKI